MDLEQDRWNVLDDVYRVYVEFGPNSIVKASEIAERLDLDRLAMEKTLHWLAGHGYIVWPSAVEDGLTITASGIDAIERARQDKARVSTKPSKPGTQIEERYVFISHSSKDTIVVSAVKQAFAGLAAKPYFAEETTAGVPPSKEIAEAVEKAEALFVFFTTNTLHDDTRDWIVFEIGVAVAHRKRIYSWKEEWIKKEQLPRLLEQVSKYAEFTSQTSEGALKLTGDIRDIAKKL